MEPESRRPIAAIVLAAGSSRRFGSQKLLADVGGQPMIRRTVLNILASAVDVVLVVVGADDEAVRGALGGLDVAFIHNPRHAHGMGTSIAAGIRSLSGDVTAALLALGDQPTVGAALVDALIDAFRDDRPIVAPEFDGVIVPPVLFGRALFGALGALEGDTGARGVIEADRSLVRVVAMKGPPPPDVDSPADRLALGLEPFADGG